MKAFPTLHSERLVLRLLRESDFAALLQYVNHQSVSDNILNFPFPYGVEDAVTRLKYAQKGFETGARYVFVVALEETDGFIGEISLHLDRANNKAEMGFWIGEPFWSKGYMTEAVGEVLRFAFEDLGLNKVVATHFVENAASGKVLAKSGMVKEGELKEEYLHAGKYRSINRYRLLEREFSEPI